MYLGRREWAAQHRGAQALWRRPPNPAQPPWLRESGGRGRPNASASLAESAAAAHRQHGLDAQALRRAAVGLPLPRFYTAHHGAAL
jgi:hypothetical protein